MFDVGFRKAFMPLYRPLPMPGSKLGQESDPGFITSYDQGPPAEGISDLWTSYDQGPPAEGIPDLWTSYDQGPPAQPVPGIVTWKDLQASSSPAEWGKFAQELVKGAGTGFGAYQKAQATFNTQRAKAGLPALPLATAAAAAPSGLSPNVIFLVGGLAVAVIAALALS